MLARLLFAISGAALLLQATACSNYVLITIRGTTEPQGPSAEFVGMIASTLNAVPGGAEYDLVYPASWDFSSPGTGITNLLSFISTAVASCPQQKYALLGYSQGAMVAGFALANITPGSPAYNAIKGVLLVGNPGHKPNRIQDFDETGGRATQSYTGALNWAGAGIPDSWYAKPLLDICHTQDFVCANNQQGANGFAHGLYGVTPSVQQQGANFLTSLFK